MQTARARRKGGPGRSCDLLLLRALGRPRRRPMSIMPTQTRRSQHRPDNCPAWCLTHIEGDTSILHMSQDNIVETTAYGEIGEVHLSIEQGEHHTDGAGIIAIRMDDKPMTPTEALELAPALTFLPRR